MSEFILLWCTEFRNLFIVSTSICLYLFSNFKTTETLRSHESLNLLSNPWCRIFGASERVEERTELGEYKWKDKEEPFSFNPFIYSFLLACTAQRELLKATLQVRSDNFKLFLYFHIFCSHSGEIRWVPE